MTSNVIDLKSQPTHYATFWDSTHREVSIGAYDTAREGVRLKVTDIPGMILELKALHDTATGNQPA